MIKPIVKDIFFLRGGDGYARGYTGRDRSAGHASGEQGSVCGDGCEYDRCE